MTLYGLCKLRYCHFTMILSNCDIPNYQKIHMYFQTIDICQCLALLMFATVGGHFEILNNYVPFNFWHHGSRSIILTPTTCHPKVITIDYSWISILIPLSHPFSLYLLWLVQYCQRSYPLWWAAFGLRVYPLLLDACLHLTLWKWPHVDLLTHEQMEKCFI